LGIFVIASVLVIVGSGWYINQYRPLHETVITVNDTEFKMDYYIKMLKFFGEGQSSAYVRSLTDQVVMVIQRNELVRQEAESKLGISVSQEEINEELKSSDPPLSEDYQDLVRAQLLMSKLDAEYFEQQIPVSTEQRQLMAMFLENEVQASEVRTRLEAGEDFAELAGEFSLSGLSDNGSLGWQVENLLELNLGTSVPGGYAFGAEVGALSQPLHDETMTKSVGYWLIEVLEREEDVEEASVQTILLGSEKEAREVRARLEAGEDFAALAKELSQLDGAEADSGYLGLLTPGMMTLAFDEVVFNAELEPGAISEPVRDTGVMTEGGYWLVKVVGKADDKQIEEADRDLLKAKAVNGWLEALWDNPENIVDNSLDDEKKAWAVARVSSS
jgi:parvulin-like peptidyl-prolyl isomerase